MKKYAKVFDAAMTAIMVVFFAWLVVSVIDVATHSLDAQPKYLPFNLFKLFM